MNKSEQDVLKHINAEAQKFKDNPPGTRNLETEIEKYDGYVWLQNQGSVKDMLGKFSNNDAVTVLEKLCSKQYILKNGFGGLLITTLGHDEIGNWEI